MQISPYQNGVHSVAEGLRSFAGYVEKANDPFLLKDAIIRLHHGLETLFKDILFQRNPIFIISDKVTIGQTIGYYNDFYLGKNDYLLDDAQTITPLEALSRIEKLHFGNMSQREHAQIAAAFKELNVVRNSLQHFTVLLRPDIIIKTLGNLIPKSLKLIKACYAHSNDTPITQMIAIVPHMHLRNMDSRYFSNLDEDLVKFYPEALNIIALLETKYDTLLNSCVKFFKKASFPSLAISLRIKDRGEVGAPPYMPDIKLAGWINGEFTARSGPLIEESLKPLAVYEGETDIKKTNLPRSECEAPSTYKSQINIRSILSLTELHSEKLLNIQSTEDQISFMRSPKLLIETLIEAIVVVEAIPGQFIVRSVEQLDGESTITLISELYGDPKETPSIKGVQKNILNKDNTSLEFVGFLTSNDALKDNFVLDINFKQAADLVFL